MIKRVSTFRLSNNNLKNGEGGYGLLAAYRRACGSSRLGWSKGRWLLGNKLYSSREPSELSQWLCYDDSTINIVLVIIIIIIIPPFIYLFLYLAKSYLSLIALILPVIFLPILLLLYIAVFAQNI